MWTIGNYLNTRIWADVAEALRIVLGADPGSLITGRDFFDSRL
jgi:hypothetical protein